MTAKRIFLLRHGESVFNALFDATGTDPQLPDAGLSDLGRQQVREVIGDVREIDPDIIITSPLTRALRTTEILREEIRAPVAVAALHREHQMHSCDIGRPKSVLEREFPWADLRNLPEIWWSQEQDQGQEPPHALRDRVERFKHVLARRPEQGILVVGHGEFFFQMTGHDLRNCELTQWRPSRSR